MRDKGGRLTWDKGGRSKKMLCKTNVNLEQWVKKCETIIFLQMSHYRSHTIGLVLIAEFNVCVLHFFQANCIAFGANWGGLLIEISYFSMQHVTLFMVIIFTSGRSKPLKKMTPMIQRQLYFEDVALLSVVASYHHFDIEMVSSIASPT